MKKAIKFSEPQKYILTTLQRLNYFLSGVGAGKSFLMGVVSAYFSQNFPDSVGLIAANSHTQLNTATLVQVREAWTKLGMHEGKDYVIGIIPPPDFVRRRQFKSYNSVISFPNGSIIFTASLERYKLLDGKNLSYALIDEIKDAEPAAIKEVILPRLRQGGIYLTADKTGLTHEEIDEAGEKRDPFAPLYLFSSPSRNAWLNEMFDLDKYETEINALTYNEKEFFAKEYDDKCVVISSSFHNTHLPRGFVKNQVNTMSDRDAKMLIYANPFFSIGGEFYPMFSRASHVKPCKIVKGEPLHITVDFNVFPYVSMVISQIHVADTGKMTIRIVDEICARPPHNRTDAMCSALVAKYHDEMLAGSVYIYGDSSGRNGSTRSKDNDFDIMRNVLRQYMNNTTMRVPTSNPSIIKRKDFINNILAGVYSDMVNIEVDPRAKNTIKDFEGTKEGPDGKKDKKKIKDKETGRMYEPFGHLTDATDYFFVEIQRRLFDRYFK